MTNHSDPRDTDVVPSPSDEEVQGSDFFPPGEGWNQDEAATPAPDAEGSEPTERFDSTSN